MSRTARATIATAVSGIALWLALRNAHLDNVRSALTQATFVWLLPYPLFCIGLNLLRGEIWRQLLERRVTSIQAFWAYSIGFLANNLLPFRIGEGARVVVLATRCRMPIVEVGAAAGLERLLDMAMLALILVVIAPVVTRVPGLASAGTLVVVLVAAALLAIAILARVRDRSVVFVERMTSWMSSAASHNVVVRWAGLMRGLSVLCRPSIGIPTFVASAVVWLLTVVSQWLVLRAFQPHASLVDAAFMITAVSLAIALPAAPGFVGVYHWAGQQALVLAFPQRYDASTALAAATIAHAVSYVTSTALGVVGLWYFGMTPAGLVGVARGSEVFERRTDDARPPVPITISTSRLDAIDTAR